jgi:hypothetical protein
VAAPAAAPRAAPASGGGSGAVGVSGLRFDWKTVSSGANKGGTYFRLYFDAHVRSSIDRRDRIYTTSECRDAAGVKVDTYSIGSSKLWEVPAGGSSTLDYLFFFSDPLNGRPASCNLTFRLGALEKNAVPFASFCYAGGDIRSGACR